MQIDTRRQSGREKDEAAVKLLEKLQDQLRSSDASIRRRAAFNLSWMQEDGLEILKGALYGNLPTTTKNAAAYGLRKMRGRMKKIALDVLNQGLKRRDKSTRDICRNALQLLGHKVQNESEPREQTSRRSRIKEIQRKSRPRRVINTRRTR
jgi:HEAT repeat protein